MCITDHEILLNIWGNIHNALNQTEKNIEALNLSIGVRTGLAIHCGQDRQEEGADGTPMCLGQEHCAAMSWAGKGPAAVLVGLGEAVGRRSWVLSSSELSRAREAKDF